MTDFHLPEMTPKKGLLIVASLIIMSALIVVVVSSLPQRMSQFTVAGVSPMMSPGGYAHSLNAVSDQVLYNENAKEYVSPVVLTDYGMPQPAPSSAPQSDSKIIKSGDLALLVSNVDDAVLKITALRKTMNGEEGNASFHEYRTGVRSGDMTLWVPSERFGDTMTAIKKFALRVENENVRTTDVSAQYVDIAARLKNLRATEVQYVEIMKRAGKISEVVEVVRVLSQTRAEIEQLQAELDQLSRRVALSSIHVVLTQEDTPGVVTDEWRPFSVAKTAFKQTLTELTHFADLLIVFIVKLPVILLNIGFWVFIFWALYRGIRFMYHRIKGESFFVKD